MGKVMIRVVIADASTDVRAALNRLLALASDIAVVGEAETGVQALAAVRGGACDLLLLDMALPGLGGVDLISRIHAQEPRLPILVHSMDDEPQIVKRILRAGASDCLPKDGEPKRLFAAIRNLTEAAGEVVEPPEWEREALAR